MTLRGRPKKKQYTEMINFAVSKKTKKKLLELSVDCGIPLSALVRYFVLSQLPKEQEEIEGFKHNMFFKDRSPRIDK